MTTGLLDLLAELREPAIPLMVGGGFGLYLKRSHVRRARERTLLEAVPDIRSTNDLDLFLRVEVLGDLARTERVRSALVALGYVAVEEAKFMQWKRRQRVGDTEQDLKVDLLVGPLGADRSRFKVSAPRVRPRGKVEIHAHSVEEAVGLEEDPILTRIEGVRSDGVPDSGTVHLPQAFPYLMMKLHAFDDRKGDADKGLGRHHALDVYAIVGMMTEPEYDRACAFGTAHQDDPHVRRARQIVADHFATPTGFGVVRLREHALFRADFDLDGFCDVLGEIFPP